jgi:predicted ATPase
MNDKQKIIYEYLLSVGYFKSFCVYEVKYLTDTGQVDKFINFINNNYNKGV